MSDFDDLFDPPAVRHHGRSAPPPAGRAAGAGQADEHHAQVETHDAVTAEKQSAREVLAKEQRRIEDEVASIEAKAAEVDKQALQRHGHLAQGAAGAPGRPRVAQATPDPARGPGPRGHGAARTARRRAGADPPSGPSSIASSAELEAARVEAEGAAGHRAASGARPSASELAPSIPAELIGALRAAAAAARRHRRGPTGRVRTARAATSRLPGRGARSTSATSPPTHAVHCEECGRLLVR